MIINWTGKKGKFGVKLNNYQQIGESLFTQPPVERVIYYVLTCLGHLPH